MGEDAEAEAGEKERVCALGVMRRARWRVPFSEEGEEGRKRMALGADDIRGVRGGLTARRGKGMFAELLDKL